MEKLPVEVGQVWRRKPAGFLYKVEEVGVSTGQNVKLQNLHDHRTSWISQSGLRAKFDLTDHNLASDETRTVTTVTNADGVTVVVSISAAA